MVMCGMVQLFGVMACRGAGLDRVMHLLRRSRTESRVVASMTFMRSNCRSPFCDTGVRSRTTSNET